SGSGKSTLLSLIGGLDRPTAGTVRVGERDLATLGPRELAAYRAETVGFVFQAFHLQPRFPAWENVALPLVFAGVSRRERRRHALAVLDRVGLGDRAGHRPSQLSGGEQQRVALARSLIRSPTLLLGDEPTGNLDTETSRQVLDLLLEVNREGTTLLLVTHDPDLVRLPQARFFRLADGLLVSPERAGDGAPAGDPEVGA
ncbi:MAG: ABC transporter ATP-binding protein, partial [Planctomycetota bacterium]